MLRRYYIFNPMTGNDVEEVTKDEWDDIIGHSPVSGYANQVYREIITIDEVPIEYRSEVENIVSNKIAKWGEYQNQEISSLELQAMIEEVL